MLIKENNMISIHGATSYYNWINDERIAMLKRLYDNEKRYVETGKHVLGCYVEVLMPNGDNFFGWVVAHVACCKVYTIESEHDNKIFVVENKDYEKIMFSLDNGDFVDYNDYTNTYW